MAGSRTEKHTAVYRNVKRCEFHNIGDYIVVTSIIGGTTFCAFFDSGLHTEESIKRRGSIKLHSIYAKEECRDNAVLRIYGIYQLKTT